MAFTLLSQMEQSRQQKETLLRKKVRNKSLIYTGIFLSFLTTMLIAISAYGNSISPAETSTSGESSNSLFTSLCIGCFGLPAFILLVVSGAVTLSLNQQVKSAEEEYQKLMQEVVYLIEGR
jgi:hypothetical protein